MASDKLFQAALLISLLVHGVVLLQNPNFNLPFSNKNETKLEISYVKPSKETKPPLKAASQEREPFLRLPQNIVVSNKLPPPYIDKETVFKKEKTASLDNKEFSKPIFNKPEIVAIKKKITLPPIDLNKISNPTYISYYQVVREKIKRAAYQIYSGTEEGEATISFIVSSDGYLQDLKLLEEKSSSSEYILEIALRSVKDASPFPAFPRELDYPQLSFNLTITFEVE
jgi:TonB family protein